MEHMKGEKILSPKQGMEIEQIDGGGREGEGRGEGGGTSDNCRCNTLEYNACMQYNAR